MIASYVGQGCGGRDSVGCETGLQGGLTACEQSPARQANGAVAYGKTVWSWHPLLVSSRRRFLRTQPGSKNCQFADDGDKTNSSPGRARHKP
jgi:hypothetical protein